MAEMLEIVFLPSLSSLDRAQAQTQRSKRDKTSVRSCAFTAYRIGLLSNRPNLT